MRNKLVLLSLLMGAMAPVAAQQVSIGIWSPHLSIGINLPTYPVFAPVPGYPVYYAPRLNLNYFFYDGMYWVYQDDNWYASSWYNGPWGMVEPEFVPVYVLRVPVRYYRRPPVYFRGWAGNAAPRWGQHWGNEWAQRRSGWDRRERNAAPAPAPLPIYQRQYSGERYPRVEQQRDIHERHYRYQPRDSVVRQQYQAPRERSMPPTEQRGGREMRDDRQRYDPPAAAPHGGPNAARPPARQQGNEGVLRNGPTQGGPNQRAPDSEEQRRSSQPGAASHPDAREKNRGQGHGSGRGKDKDRDHADERGRGNRDY